MAGKFFSEHKVAELHQKTVEQLTRPLDAFEAKLPFSASRAKALLHHQAGIANLIADTTMQRLSNVGASVDILNVKMERVEAIIGARDPSDKSEQELLYYADDLTACKTQIKKLEQRLAAMQKQLAALDRKVHS